MGIWIHVLYKELAKKTLKQNEHVINNKLSLNNPIRKYHIKPYLYVKHDHLFVYQNAIVLYYVYTKCLYKLHLSIIYRIYTLGKL